MNKIKDFLKPFLRKKVNGEIKLGATQQEQCPEIIRAYQAIYSNDVPSPADVKNTLNAHPLVNTDSNDSGSIVTLETVSDTNLDELVDNLLGIITEFDTYISQASNDDVKQVLQICQYRIIESLIKIGLTPVDSDKEFDPSLHIPVPYSIPKGKVEIAEFVRTGLRNKDRILLKAKVRLYANS